MDNEQTITNVQANIIEINFKILSKERIKNNLELLHKKLFENFENLKQDLNKIDSSSTLEDIVSKSCKLYLVSTQLATVAEIKNNVENW